MFRYLLIGYIIIYCVFAIFLFVAYARIVPSGEKKSDKPWETPLDLILLVIGLAGMLFLLLEVESSTLKAVWRPVSITLAATQLYGNLKAWREVLRSGEAKPDDSAVLFSHILTILFLLPSICLNIYYAFR